MSNPHLFESFIGQTERPLRLIAPAEELRVLCCISGGPPVQFIWRHQVVRIVRYSAPERIPPEGRHDCPRTRLRDYFKVEDDLGRRLWIYREGLGGDGHGGTTRWFLHGVFV